MRLLQWLLSLFRPSIPERVDPDACAAFWRWFVDNEEQLFASIGGWRTGQEIPPGLWRVVDQVSARIARVHPELGVNIGQLVEDDVRRELVITVEARRRAVPWADAILEAAPPLARWKLVRFKPATGGPELVVEYEDATLAVTEVEALAELIDGELIVVLFIPNASSPSPLSRAMRSAAVVLVDAMVGEERMLTKVDTLQVLPFDTNVAAGVARFPVLELPGRLDALRPDPS